MNVSRREMQLGLITGVVLLGALTWWMVETPIHEWSELGDKAENLKALVTKQERLAAKKPELIQQLDRIKSLLPVHPDALDLKPRMLQQVKQVADAQNIVLSSMKPRDEKIAPQTGLSEQSIDCAFDGDFSNLVRFLYDIEAQGPVLAISKANIRSDQRAGRMKGTLTIDFAYARGVPPPTPPEATVPTIGAAPAPGIPEPSPEAVVATPPSPSANIQEVPPPAPGPALPVPALPGVPSKMVVPASNPSAAFPQPSSVPNRFRTVAAPLPEYLDKEDTLMLNLGAQSLDEILDDYARYTGKSVIRDESVREIRLEGSSTRKVSVGVYLLAVEKALLRNNLELVPVGDQSLRVVSKTKSPPAASSSSATPPLAPSAPGSIVPLSPSASATNRIQRVNPSRPVRPSIPPPVPPQP